MTIFGTGPRLDHGGMTIFGAGPRLGHGEMTIYYVSPPNIVISPWLRHFTRGSGDFNHGPGHFLTVAPAYMTVAHGSLIRREQST